MPVDSIDNSSFYQAERRKDSSSPEEIERRKAFIREQRNREIDEREARRVEQREIERTREMRQEEIEQEEMARETDKGRYIDEIV